MNEPFANPVLGYARMTTEHAASSYNIPVIVDEHGQAYGPNDAICPPNDPLAWIAALYCGFPDGTHVLGKHLVEKFWHGPQLEGW